MTRPIAGALFFFGAGLVGLVGCGHGRHDDAASSSPVATSSQPANLEIPQDISLPTRSPGATSAIELPTRKPPTPCTIELSLTSDLFFEFNSAVVAPNRAAELVAFVEATIADNPDRRLVRVDVAGYASQEGDEEWNQTLSSDRAATAAGVLAGIAAVDDVPINHVGMGETDQFGPGLDEASLRLNRRVLVDLHFNGCPLPAPPTRTTP